ncbi:unnamed protein product [Cercopithifilaria johnstoni]|uniref:Uncharacterized protein n=1 Tax=Cercopithifilaria johnstoni TaxID=2874296 RepID=A0A8J2MU64_9BILA|nr:unnamed protein product [Cercopithifilaria johnstoni]
MDVCGAKCVVSPGFQWVLHGRGHRGSVRLVGIMQIQFLFFASMYCALLIKEKWFNQSIHRQTSLDDRLVLNLLTPFLLKNQD